MESPPEGLFYIPGILTVEEQVALLQQLQELEYKRDVFRGQRLKRAYAQFGYAYVPTSRKLNPAPVMPDFLTSLIAKGGPHCPEDTPFNQCIATHYPKGAGIGWHIDAPRFGGCIMAVSVGAAARLQFRPNGSKEVSYEELVVPGSLYVVRGPIRWAYQHRVVAVTSTRYSLTFRYVRESTE